MHVCVHFSHHESFRHSNGSDPLSCTVTLWDHSNQNGSIKKVSVMFPRVKTLLEYTVPCHQGTRASCIFPPTSPHKVQTLLTATLTSIQMSCCLRCWCAESCLPAAAISSRQLSSSGMMTCRSWRHSIILLERKTDWIQRWGYNNLRLC